MKNHFVDLYNVLPPNHYLFILFIYFICHHRRWFCCHAETVLPW